MAKKIKVAFITIFVLVLSCLIMTSCTNIKNLSTNSQQVASPEDFFDYSKEFTLQGTREEMSTQWNDIITYCRTTANKSVLVTLANDWIADDSEIHSLGSGLGFQNNSIINVPSYVHMTFDLNGFTIDKRHTEPHPSNYGMAFANYGTFILKDSKYNSEEVKAIYESNKDNPTKLQEELRNVQCGKITGCWSNGQGGAIWNVGQFYMYGGMLIDNNALGTGSAIFSSNHHGTKYPAILEIKNGIILNNNATMSGTIYANCPTVIENAYIVGNSAEYGGGICVGNNINTHLIMDNVKIVGNKAIMQGGGIYADNSLYQFTNCDITYNTSDGSQGGIFSRYNNILYNIGGEMQIKNNTSKGKPSNLKIFNGTPIYIDQTLTENSRIEVEFDSNYDIFTPFTTGFGERCKDIDPAAIFTTSDSKKIAKLKNNEVVFEFNTTPVYDYIYLEEIGDKTYRKNYTDGKLIHNYNDITINNGRFILGNIAPYTSVNTFVKNLELNYIDTSQIKIFNRQNTLIYNKGNNIAGISEYYDNKYNLAVGTGWRIEIYTADDKLVETIYLSVLGDITGDGKINSTDITYLKQISTKEIDFTSLSLEQQLASMIDNRGMISVVDVQILKAYTNYEVDIKLYF